MADVTITLDRDDLGQIIDGLTARMEAYQKTAEYLDGSFDDDGTFVVEDVRDAAEAKRIAGTYQRILSNLASQIGRQ